MSGSECLVATGVKLYDRDQVKITPSFDKSFVLHYRSAAEAACSPPLHKKLPQTLELPQIQPALSSSISRPLLNSPSTLRKFRKNIRTVHGLNTGSWQQICSDLVKAYSVFKNCLGPLEPI